MASQGHSASIHQHQRKHAGTPASRYFLVAFAFVIALAFSFTVPAVRASSPYFPFLIAVAIGAWICGTSTALFVTAFSSLALLFELSQRFSFVPSRTDLIRLCLFIGTSLLVTFLTRSRHNASESFKDLVESAPDALIGVNDNGDIVVVNSQAEQLFGYSRSELLGQKIELLVPERFRASHIYHQQEYKAHPRVRGMGTMDLRARRKDGSEFPAEISLSPIRTDRGMLVASIIRDLTERRKIEDAREQLIREQTARAEAEAMQQRFRDLVQDLDAIVWELDIQKRMFTFVSDRALDILGYPIATWTSARDFWLAHVHPQDRSAILKFVRNLAHGGPNNIEYRATTHNKDIVWLRGIIYIVRNNKGEPQCLRGLLVDITARKFAEEAMRTTEKLAATGRLAASIAHEINNPMAAVTNLLYLIEQNPTLDHGGRKYARLAQEELARVAHITRQMLGFYRDSVAAAPVNVSELIDNILDLYRRRADADGVRITRELSEVEDIKAFPGELRQVFSNFLLNAMEAVGPRGTIKIRVASARNWSHPEQTGIRVTFADDGVGIPRDHRQRVFEPFFTTKGQKGTGLGLWVSHGIVQKHGGNIRVRSRTAPESHWTVFSIFLPSEMADTPQQSAPNTAAWRQSA